MNPQVMIKRCNWSSATELVSDVIIGKALDRHDGLLQLLFLQDLKLSPLALSCS